MVKAVPRIQAYHRMEKPCTGEGVAFSTAGIADMPVNGISKGAIVATISAYFMRPLQRPSKQIIDTIEYNLAQLDDLSIEELERLKDTTDSLIKHMKHLKEARGEQ